MQYNKTNNSFEGAWVLRKESLYGGLSAWRKGLWKTSIVRQGASEAFEGQLIDYSACNKGMNQSKFPRK